MLRLVPLIFITALIAGTSLARSQTMVVMPLTANSGGALHADIRLNGISDRFLLDTGAAMLTINQHLFERSAMVGGAVKLRQVAARLADGRIRRFDVYRFDTVVLADGCSIPDVEAVVVPGKGRNLLGLNVLTRFAPFSMAMDPPSIGLSGCEKLGLVKASPELIAPPTGHGEVGLGSVY